MNSKFMLFLLSFFALFTLTSCSSIATPSTGAPTSTSVDPVVALTTEVLQFVENYVNGAISSRPHLTHGIKQSDLEACVSSYSQQIVRTTISSNEKKTDESTTDWYSRAKSAALQTTQSGIEGLIATCTRNN